MAEETFVERKVTYALQVDGRFVIVEGVPARVCVETVERLQQLFWGHAKPARVIDTPVLEFVA